MGDDHGSSEFQVSGSWPAMHVVRGYVFACISLGKVTICNPTPPFIKPPKPPNIQYSQYVRIYRAGKFLVLRG